MKKILISSVLFLFLFSCKKVLVTPVPDYMFEIFPENQECAGTQYVRLTIGDSTISLTETMDGVSITNGIYEKNREVSKGRFRFNIQFVDDDDRAIGYQFAKPGSYKFYTSQPMNSAERYSSGVFLGMTIGNNYYYSLPGSAFFHVNGRSTNEGVNICGDFDVLMGSDSVRVTGEYSLIYYDDFF